MNIKFDHDAEWVTGGLRLAPVHRTLKTRGLSTEGGALVVNLEQGVTMAAKWKFLAAGSAAVVAIGGAGLYAGALSVSSSGLSGAGSVALQASCATAATVTPGAAPWNATVQKFTYTTVSVAYTEGSTDACSGQKLRSMCMRRRVERSCQQAPLSRLPMVPTGQRARHSRCPRPSTQD